MSKYGSCRKHHEIISFAKRGTKNSQAIARKLVEGSKKNILDSMYVPKM